MGSQAVLDQIKVANNYSVVAKLFQSRAWLVHSGTVLHSVVVHLRLFIL